ncbi:MAG: ABC transporter permease, partial [Alphaproteobacteria bacterium]|nr:ABC transporter permease [Alphaproteobacteria bacterium]
MTKSTKIFKYVGKRLLQGIPIILAIVIINFFLLNLAEGDAVDVLAGEAGSA